MGKPIKIINIAKTLVRLYGYEPYIGNKVKKPIKWNWIKFTKLRLGEKLYEELLIGNNPQKTLIKKYLKQMNFI